MPQFRPRFARNALLLGAIAFSPVRAQLAPGTRIRARADTLGERPVVAVLVVASRDSVVLRPLGWRSAEGQTDTVMTLPRTALKRLEVANGTYRETKKGAWWGLFGGMLVGGFVGYSRYELPACPANAPLFSCHEDEHTAAAVGGALAGGIVGVIGGALLGHYVVSDRWVPADGEAPRVSIAPRRNGLGIRVSMSVR